MSEPLLENDTSPPLVPIADVLSRAGHELTQLAWLLDHLQEQIGPHIQERASRDPGILRQMQSFDRIGQNTEAIAGFLAALAHAVPRCWLVDPGAAARAIPLADLSARLGFADEDKEACATAWGQCDFF